MRGSGFEEVYGSAAAAVAGDGERDRGARRSYEVRGHVAAQLALPEQPFVVAAICERRRLRRLT
jgi:hypothetical protein